jgi:hypothetical protein
MRRFYLYIGLYLLFFSWLFAFTGLLLNHPRWEFAQFWPNRIQSAAVQEFRAPAGSTDLDPCADSVGAGNSAGRLQAAGHDRVRTAEADRAA